RLFYRGEWTEGLYLADGATADDLGQFERFHALLGGFAGRRGSDGRTVFTLPVDSCSRDPSYLVLDRVSMAAWMAKRGFDSPRLLWWVEYATRDDYGGRLHNTSAWAALHYFCSRRTGPEDEGADYLTWPEGNQFLVSALAKRLGERRRTGAIATAVVQDGDRVRVTWMDARAGTAHSILADHVVCAVPRFVARRIVPALDGEGTGFTYTPWVVANLSLEAPPRQRGFPTCWDNVLYESESLGYVVATHQSDRLDRDTVWTWYRPFPDDDETASREHVLQAPWEHWRDTVMRDLVRAHPDLGDRVTNIDVRRWGHAMVRPRPGFLWSDERVGASRPRGRIHFAGADLGGLPLFEEAQWHGVRAAEEILEARGEAVVSLL
ncbi:MAG: FAD-dependent oxidoreductase, partial [Planctomycetota bacterium]